MRKNVGLHTVMKLSYIFIFALCYYRQASTRLLISNNKNDGYKLSQENQVSLFRDHLETRPATTKSIVSMYTQICLECRALAPDCESKLNAFCDLPETICDILPLLDANCQSVKSKNCLDDIHCTIFWTNSRCFSRTCICEYSHIPNYAHQKCQLPFSATTRTKIYNGVCSSTFNCKFINGWSDLVCQSNRCICPSNSLPDYLYKRCIKINAKENDSNFTEYKLIIIVAAIVVCVVICACRIIIWVIRFRNSIGLSARHIGATGTSSTPEFVDRANLPPEYSTIFTITSQTRNDEELDKLPTYEEVERHPQWNAQPVRRQLDEATHL